MMKQIMIPLAAFAVTVTGASAFGGTTWLDNTTLTDNERSAFEQVEEVRDAARAEVERIFEDAGIDDERMQEIRDERKSIRSAARTAVREAIQNADYAAFTDAVIDTPLAEAIDSESDFETLLEAHELMQTGDREGAQALMEELGVEGMHKIGDGHENKRGFGGPGHPGQKGDRQSAETE